MGQALYRKYRSRALDEVVGQEHITDTLKRAIASGRISHAYLFTGPRGVGKTSIARILAHELNGVEYSGEDNHLDIIEIDAASSGGVDEVRDLREKVYIAPSAGKYKVYIIDEVHMMTTAAFNALLKTLEEPPAHTIFILATTEAHKLPATIISRTQRFTFKPIARDRVIAHLRYIADEEKIDITDDALELIAEHGGGSFRDSIGMLDQASSVSKHIDRQAIETLLGIPPSAVTDRIITCMRTNDTAALVALLADLKANGYQAAGIAKQLGQNLRAQLIAGTSGTDASKIISLLGRLIDIPPSHNPDQLLELVLLEATLGPAASTIHAVKQPESAVPLPPATTSPDPEPVPKPKARPALAKAASATKPKEETVPDETTKASTDSASDLTITAETWQTLLASLKKEYNTLYGIIRMARPEFSPGRVSLTFGYAFHQKRANDVKNKKILTSTLEELTGAQIAVDCHYDKTVTPPAMAIPVPPNAPTETPNAALGAISNIFGGGELLK